MMNLPRACFYRWNKYCRAYFWPIIAALIVAALALSAFVLYRCERAAGENMTAFDAVRVVIVFALGEYGETPRTLVGRAVSLVLFVLGIVVIAAFIGKVASLFFEIHMEIAMPQNVERHIVICQWHENGDRIVKELHSKLAVPEVEILIITPQAVNEQELRLDPAYEKVFFIRSDPTRHEVLRRARAPYARSVILLANPDAPDPDAQTALTALAISRIVIADEPKPHIIAEVADAQKIRHLMDAGVDEWVCSASYGTALLAHAAIFGKISDVYQQLLTYSTDTNEIYLVDEQKYPAEFFGMSFHKVATILNNHRQVANPTILIGVKRQGKILLNPRADEFDLFRPGDCLIVMSFDPPDLRTMRAEAR